ncbi:hypothetical protein [Aldersonia kunmingensis]|uniref:hypothetical protein n=1 Tax=Aldersonia kunmingensis TaxID=408066 RepID=UPI000A84F997|nr:hypothetical protein [Aldersonia kunmingensis]
MRKTLTATLLAATAGLTVLAGTGTASADTADTVSYHARFCSTVQDGNDIALQVNIGHESDYQNTTAPEDTWQGPSLSNVTFDTWDPTAQYTKRWAPPSRPEYAYGMWCYTVVRTDLREGDWIRLWGGNPASHTMTAHLTEVVEVNGVVTERGIANAGWGGNGCCGGAFGTIPALTDPDPVDPTPVDPEPVDPEPVAPSTGSFGS